MTLHAALVRTAGEPEANGTAKHIKHNAGRSHQSCGGSRCVHHLQHNPPNMMLWLYVPPQTYLASSLLPVCIFTRKSSEVGV